MSEQKTELVEDVLGDFGFRVRWRYVSHWADVEVFEIVARSGDDLKTIHFERKAATGSMDHVESIDEAEPYLEGFIKWDGCSELNQGQPHWCGVNCFKKHAELLRYLWEKSEVIFAGGSRSVMDFQTWDKVIF